MAKLAGCGYFEVTGDRMTSRETLYLRVSQPFQDLGLHSPLVIDSGGHKVIAYIKVIAI